jgi:hypothetical protein
MTDVIRLDQPRTQDSWTIWIAGANLLIGSIDSLRRGHSPETVPFYGSRTMSFYYWGLLLIAGLVLTRWSRVVLLTPNSVRFPWILGRHREFPWSTVNTASWSNPYGDAVLSFFNLPGGSWIEAKQVFALSVEAERRVEVDAFVRSRVRVIDAA